MNKILIIEDERVLAKALRDILERSGFEVDVASDGEEGVAKVAASRPDLILLDLILPRLHGFEVLKRIKENPDTKATPVIILSNLDQGADIDQARQLGAADFLTKAETDINSVLAKVKEHLTGASIRTE